KGGGIWGVWARGVHAAIGRGDGEARILHHPLPRQHAGHRPPQQRIRDHVTGWSCWTRPRAALRSATAAPRSWPFRRRPVGKSRNELRFAARGRRLDAPSTWPCLRARRAPPPAPVRATPYAAQRAALARVFWLPAPCARSLVSSCRCRTDRRSRANVLTGRSPRCASPRAFLQSGRRCARRPAVPTAVCREIASSPSPWLLSSLFRATSSPCAGGHGWNVAQGL